MEPHSSVGDPIALHIADGVVGLPVSALFGVVAAAWVSLCLIRARRDLDDRLAPLAGLVAAFIFAVQMLNFPVLPGVSGHLLGGALAVILVGPYVGAVCVATVLVVQALLFADGGLSALGLNITNMALVTTLVGYGVAAVLLRVLPKNRRGVVVASFVAALVSVVVASQAFVFQYALGAGYDLDQSLSAIAATMGGFHVLIGVGEGLITATTVATVAAVRPDLVYALRRFRPAPPPLTVAPRPPIQTGSAA